MPLVINALRGGHTDTDTYQHANKNDFKKPGVLDLWPCAFGLKTVSTGSSHIKAGVYSHATSSSTLL